MTHPRVPYVNLAAQHAQLKEALLQAVARVLEHGQFILGPEVAQVEAKLAAWTGARHVIGVGNGTDALLLALRAHGIGAGDEVITVSHTFFATVSAIVLAGATPVLVDVDAETMLIDPTAVRAAITPRTRAVLPVHLNGHPCPMDELQELCRANGLVLIEDCAQALGARYRDAFVGSFGTGCFSLHPLKVLSACGDAGFITTSDDALAARLRQLRNLGLRDRDHCDHVSGNSRLDTLQAAILLVKLEHLPRWLEERAAHAAAYREALSGWVALPPALPWASPVHTAFVVRHPSRDALLERLHAHGIDAKIHYPLPVHRQEAFKRWTRPLPVTERVVSEMISLPISPELDVPARGRVISAVRAASSELR